jgi:5-methylcytosine-specific restriction protein A
MPAYLITWNPVIWPWVEYPDEAAAVREGRNTEGGWSTGRTMRVEPGDRLWLMRLGREPKGIIGAAVATSAAFRGEHWGDPTKTTCYVDLRWERLLDPAIEPILRLAELQDKFPGVRWTPQGSGMSIPGEVEGKLERLWGELVDRLHN